MYLFNYLILRIMCLIPMWSKDFYLIDGELNNEQG